jgi:hypothetical protein
VVFFFAIALRSRTSAAVHARRFFFIFAIKPPFQERQLVSLTGVKRQQIVWRAALFADESELRKPLRHRFLLHKYLVA